MKNHNLKYIKARIQQASTVIEMECLKDFCQYAEKHGQREIFLIEDSTKFAILTQHALLYLPTNGFTTLDDAQKAAANGFAFAKDYYAATEMNIENFEDYDLILKCGTSDKEIFSQLQKDGFLEGFKEYRLFMQENDNPNPEAPLFDTALELYKYAQNSQFENFADFHLAFKAGFSTYGDYVLANEKGFENAKDYMCALANGFQDNNIFQVALQHNILNYNQLMQKINLEVSYPDLAHDQSLALFLLSKIEQGKKVSVNKLDSLLKTAMQEYIDPETSALYPWFKKSFDNTDDISLFLRNNPDVIRFGTYDSDGEFFEINSIKDRSVVIDGSNVAYNSINDKSEKPLIANLLTMVKYLKSKGFSDILIISDASLRHKVGDIELLDDLKKEAKYEVAPAETSADLFIISYVKSKHCLLITNDIFRDHKIKDTWAAQNLDYYRLTFMITQGEVFMPDLK